MPLRHQLQPNWNCDCRWTKLSRCRSDRDIACASKAVCFLVLRTARFRLSHICPVSIGYASARKIGGDARLKFVMSRVDYCNALERCCPGGPSDSDDQQVAISAERRCSCGQRRISLTEACSVDLHFCPAGFLCDRQVGIELACRIARKRSSSACTDMHAASWIFFAIMRFAN